MNAFEAALAVEEYVLERRHYYHAHPELSMKEFETTKSISKDLTALGIEHKTFEDHPGVIGYINCAKPGRCIMLRADIDALPVQEQTGLPYASENDGVMHACGHDVHISTLLGAAKILNDHKDELCGRIVLCFEPGEEALEGVHYMLRDGVMDGVDACFGMHIWSAAPSGKIAINEGNIMAAGGKFTIDVTGRSSHGACPHDGLDAIVAASNIVMAMQTYVSRRNSPLNPLVVTVGTIEGGNRWNIVSGSAHLEGTLRTFDEEVRKNLQKDLSAIVEAAAQTLGCEAKFEYNEMWPATINSDKHMLDIARNAHRKLFNEDAISIPPTMGGESFSLYLNRVPGVYAFMGSYSEQNPYGNHHEKYNPDETVIKKDVAMFVQVAEDFLME